MKKPSIVNIRKVSKFLQKFVNAIRSLTRQNSLPSSSKRVVEKICDKASAKLEEADKEYLICLDALEMLPVQDYQPRIRFRLEDAVTVLKTIEHVENQQLGNFSRRDMENIVNAKVQILEAAFTAQMQTLLATQQKPAQNFTTAPSADDKRTAAQVEEAKGSKKRKTRRHCSDYCGDCGQDDHKWSSDACPHPSFNARKVQKRRKEEVATDTDAKSDVRAVDLGPGF
jgi:hypothetical protein